MNRKKFIKRSSLALLGTTLVNDKIYGKNLNLIPQNKSGVKITKVTPYHFKAANLKITEWVKNQ